LYTTPTFAPTSPLLFEPQQRSEPLARIPHE